MSLVISASNLGESRKVNKRANVSVRVFSAGEKSVRDIGFEKMDWQREKIVSEKPRARFLHEFSGPMSWVLSQERGRADEWTQRGALAVRHLRNAATLPRHD
jgi:hypothetical protein